MLGAGTRNSSGEDLASLRNELAKTCGVLVIYVVDLLGAKHADFLSLAVRTEAAIILCSIHDFSPIINLERKVVLGFDLLKIRGGAYRGGIRRHSVVCVGGVGLLRDRALRAAVNKMKLVGDYIGCITLVALLVGPASVLNSSDNEDGRSLLVVTCNVLGKSSPCGYVEEIGGGLLIVIRTESAVDGDAERCNLNTVLGLLQLGIGGKSSAELSERLSTK